MNHPSLSSTPEALTVRRLGPAQYASSLGLSTVRGDLVPDYVADDTFVSLDVEYRGAAGAPPARLGFEKAGPRERLFFEPSKVRAGIVTCGGLCPGTNNVVRSLVLELHHRYAASAVLGFRYGFEGIAEHERTPPVPLNFEGVRAIHKLGGTVLGSSRGPQDVARMVDALAALRLDMLFAVGGDGTLRGAHAIAEEALRRGLALAVVGVPKTIDNDLLYTDKTFGFDTAVDAAHAAIDAAHAEALGVRNGVGVVRLMGREAGFIACAATLASREVNFCLVPEVPFELEGERGLLAALEARLRARGHAVVVVAEGCLASVRGDGGDGQGVARDASGNAQYARGESDVGPLLCERIGRHLRGAQLGFSVKYIDPSYGIRGIPANSADAIFCDMLARNAAHAGMAGRTDMVVGRWHGVFTHVPIALAVSGRHRVDPDGPLWLAVTEATGQPVFAAASRAR